jgi:HK97 gp10 family phage protein
MAANSVSVRLEGVDGFLSKVRALVPKVREGTRLAVAQTALLIETDAKLFAPVDTGRLRSSIHAEIAPNGLSATVSDGVDYGIHLEFGTRFQRAQPFLYPAYEKNRQAFVALLKANTKLF